MSTREGIRFSEQNILNETFDESLGVIMVEIIGADGVLKNPATEDKQDTLIAKDRNDPAICSCRFWGFNLQLHPI
jgi:hypothetical protein